MTEQALKNLSTQDEVLFDRLRATIANSPIKPATLEVVLEAIVKHLPVYLKVVKSHISQLENVLNTEQHNHKTLETADLADIVNQLRSIFSELSEEDLINLEQMAAFAKAQQPEEASLQDEENKNPQ